MKKLTPAMAELLEAMERGIRVKYMGGVNAYYFRSDTGKPCTKQALGLLDRGMAIQSRDEAGRVTLALTEHGAG